MNERKKKLVVAAIETTGAAAATATAVAITAAAPTAAVLAAIPIMAKAAVEYVLDSKRVAESRQRREEEFFREFHKQVEAVIRKLSEAEANAAQTKSRSLDYEEVLVLLEQFFDQAMKAPQKEKRRMLAAAAAGSFRPDVATETKSRAARVIDQLEPSDVAALRRVVQVAKVASYRSELHAAMGDEPGSSIFMLLRVGCLAEQPFLEDGSADFHSQARPRPPRLRMLRDVTPLAREVLELLETYSEAPGSMERDKVARAQGK